MLSDLRLLVQDMIRDHSDRVAADQLDRALGLGVAQYSKDRPRRVVIDVEMETARNWLPWPMGATSILSVEYPAGLVPPAVLPARAWYLYDNPADETIIVHPAGFESGKIVRLTYAAPHVVSDEDDTTKAEDAEAIASYASAVLFDQMAAQTSADGNPTIQADTVNHQAKPENFAKRAERLRGRYYDLLGLDPKRVQGASATVHVPKGSTHGYGNLIRRGLR